MLNEAIIRTLCYFDLFDLALTRVEIWQWLYCDPSQIADYKLQIADLEGAVSSLLKDGMVVEENGMISLAGRMGLAQVRAERGRFSLRKMRRARRWAGWFARIPGVQLVGVGNTLALLGAKDGSDIDFFIVCKPGTLWRVRFFAALSAALAGLRPSTRTSRDRLCLSFFASSNALNLRSLALGSDDIYLAYWTAAMLPLVGNEGMYTQFRDANAWALAKFPNALSREALLEPLPKQVWFFTFLPERFYRFIQEKYFPPIIRNSLEHNDGSVVASDRYLKFHVKDRRKELSEKWQRKIHEFERVTPIF